MRIFSFDNPYFGREITENYGFVPMNKIRYTNGKELDLKNYGKRR